MGMLVVGTAIEHPGCEAINPHIIPIQHLHPAVEVRVTSATAPVTRYAHRKAGLRGVRMLHTTRNQRGVHEVVDFI